MKDLAQAATRVRRAISGLAVCVPLVLLPFLASCQSSGGYMGQTEYRVPPQKSQAELIEERLEKERRDRQANGGRNR